MEILYEEMLVSIEDYDIIRCKLQDSGWLTLFENLRPAEFGNIIAHVNIEFDQPRVAALLALVVHPNFTCQHCAAAVKSTAEWNRPSMVERLTPFCTDLAHNHHLIRAELSEWDQIIFAEIMFHNIDNYRV